MTHGPSSRKAILIIGGGASGVLLAAHMLRDRSADIRVTLIEKRRECGRGLAYSTDLPDHILNVVAIRMSAYTDDPEHFLRWLIARGAAQADNPYVYAPRRLYGEYLAAILDELAERERHTGRFHRVEGECIALVPTASGVEARLRSGASVVGHQAVLATGHDEAPRSALRHAARLGKSDGPAIAADETVVILGTGLSMVDVFLSLDNAGHRGRIVALSRRGLTPAIHFQGKPHQLDAADIPFAAAPARFMLWLRGRIVATQAAGGDWRDVMDALRPFTQEIWSSWIRTMRAQFLRHARPWWDIHRHRLPPAVHARLAAAIASGRVEIAAGKLIEAEPRGDGVQVTLRRRGSQESQAIEAARLYDCTGLSRNVSKSTNPLIKSLVDQRHARPDPLCIGLDVTSECAIITADGKASSRLFAIGPITRAAFFEIEAVPDIRQQADRLTKQLCCNSREAGAKPLGSSAATLASTELFRNSRPAASRV